MKCDEIKQWAEKIKKENKNEKENQIDFIIAHINQLFKNVFNFYLRDTQIISVLILIKKEKNLIELRRF